ncbi:hypothetical protein BaGK_07430 [Bacillus atrophaeus]|nr:hypothetical protein BaGK_07430 [Bacillus atrophaeus]
MTIYFTAALIAVSVKNVKNAKNVRSAMTKVIQYRARGDRSAASRHEKSPPSNRRSTSLPHRCPIKAVKYNRQ